jgi:hypothetical protein
VSQHSYCTAKTISLATASSVTETASSQGVTSTSVSVPATLGQSVVPTVSDSASLTTQATQSVVSENSYSDGQSMLAKIANPYPSQTPVALLSRQYKIAEFDFGSGFTTVRVPFPGALFSQPVIQAALLSFPYWRGKIKVHVRMQSIPQQSGAVMVSWLPCTNLATVSRIAASGNHATILNVSTSDSCTFVIPYCSPKAWLTYPYVTSSDHSCLYFHELVPLNVPDNVNDTVHFTIFASMEDPEVAAFKHQDAAQSASHHSQKIKAVVDPAIRAVSSIADFVEPMLGVLNLLDKPDLDPAPQYVATQPLRAMEWFTEGSVPSVQFSLKSRPYLANTVNLFPLGKSSDSFTTLASNPMLCYQKNYITGGTNGGFPVTPCVPASDLGTTWAPDYLFHFTRYATFWRGGIRYFMHFCTNQFTSARFRIGLSYKAWSSGWADSGDVPSTVVDVHGSTYFSITVPYLFNEYWRPVTVPVSNLSSYFPYLYIEMLDDPVGSTLPGDPLITLSVFRAADSDFQLAEPGYSVAYTPPPMSLADTGDIMFPTDSSKTVEPVDVAQCSLDAAFSKSFSSIVEGTLSTTELGLCMSEVMDSPAQVCKRMCKPVTPFTAALDTARDPATIPHYYLNLTSQVFSFWRGSKRCRPAFLAETAGTWITSGYPAQNIVSPSARFNSAMEDPLITMPYYSTVPYQVMSSYTYTGPTITPPANWFASGSGTGYNYRFAAGDDLVCGHLIAPMYQVNSPS